MYKVKEISDDGLDTFSKIYIRHLKELGVYTPVKKFFSGELHKSIKSYMLADKYDAYIISDLVSIAWHPVQHATKLAVKSSLVILGILFDDKFYYFLQNINYHSHRYNFDSYIKNAAIREFSYLLELDDYRYEILAREDIDRLNNVYKAFKNWFNDEPFCTYTEKMSFFRKLSKCKDKQE